MSIVYCTGMKRGCVALTLVPQESWRPKLIEDETMISRILKPPKLSAIRSNEVPIKSNERAY